jgi:hypothetical protein
MSDNNELTVVLKDLNDEDTVKSAVSQYLEENKTVNFDSPELTYVELMTAVFSLRTGIDKDTFKQKALTPEQKEVVRQSFESFNEHGTANNCTFHFKGQNV